MNPIQTVLADDPWWLIVLKGVALFVVGVVMTLLSIWAERRVIGRMQQRLGPNRNGPFGLLQTLADGIKLGLKEDIVPAAAHKAVYILAPALSVIPAFMAFAVIPFGPEVSIFGERTALQLVDYNVGVLYVLAIASIGVYGIVLAGWSSGSTYPLLGGIRSTAQVISYEVAMGLSFVAVFLWAGSMSTSEIVAQQDRVWFAFALFPSFAIYVVSMVGETNRAPFDLSEAEGELVGGFHTEYASLKFALFYLAEYVNMVTVSSLATTLFLGGWRAPWPISQIGQDAAHPDGLFNTGWWPLIWFFGKVIACLFAFVWLRGSLPRLRYDQFMDLGWKILIPVAILWLLLVATVRTLIDEVEVSRSQYLVGAAVVLGVLAAITFLVPAGDDAQDEPDEAVPFDPMAGGYPVPPMPGQIVPGAPAPVIPPQQLTPTGARLDAAARDSKEEPDA